MLSICNSNNRVIRGKNRLITVGARPTKTRFLVAIVKISRTIWCNQQATLTSSCTEDWIRDSRPHRSPLVAKAMIAWMRRRCKKCYKCSFRARNVPLARPCRLWVWRRMRSWGVQWVMCHRRSLWPRCGIWGKLQSKCLWSFLVQARSMHSIALMCLKLAWAIARRTRWRLKNQLLSFFRRFNSSKKRRLRAKSCIRLVARLDWPRFSRKMNWWTRRSQWSKPSNRPRLHCLKPCIT